MFRRIVILSLTFVAACSRSTVTDPIIISTIPAAVPGNAPLAPPALVTPSPNPTRAADSASTETYIVQYGDTLSGIALEYGTTPEAIADLNGIVDIASVGIGQAVRVPLSGIEAIGPAMKIVADSEVVYGPSAVGFDVDNFVSGTSGYLRAYTEDVEGEIRTGAQIVQLVAERYSVGPRVLLALIEHRGGWLSNPAPDALSLFYPAGHADERWSGLHKQLSWAADHLNDGYYGWKTRNQLSIRFNDFSRARIAPGLNAGTIAIQSLLALDATLDEWLIDVGPDGFAETYRDWFGDPFARTAEPLVPAGLAQPILALPWPQGETWYFTGGPHGAWASGSAWGAIDFISPEDALGCYVSDSWITAMSDGQVIRSREGEVLVDLDGDGLEQTGWVILYMHVEERDRVPVGMQLRAGDRVGHPSCEGGYSTATHVHVARRYNGEWLAAEGAIPFVIGGWMPIRSAGEYDGSLTKEGAVKEACECRDATLNGITH